MKKRKNYYNGSANEYYYYVRHTNNYKELIDKLEAGTKLNEDEGQYLLDKLYLITCKSYSEEEDIHFKDKIINSLAKLGLLLSKKNSYCYNEAYKLIEYFGSIEKICDKILI